MKPSSAPTLCIHCGLAAGDPPRLNRLEDGRACPACAERLLASLPPALPGGLAGEIEESEELDGGRTEYVEPEFDQPA